jgi:hypothetical protein
VSEGEAVRENNEHHRRDRLLFRIAALAFTELCQSLWDTTMQICDEHDIPPLGGNPPEKGR